jgi:methylated-DNA-[protein]-cysteine S-methyltransferase
MRTNACSLWRSPLGWVGLAASPLGMTAVTSPRATPSAAWAELKRIVGHRTSNKGNIHIRKTKTALGRYFRDASSIDLGAVKLDEAIGTAFEKLVWKMLREIPFGETRTYSELARLAGHPRGARAVGRCNAKNPWSIVVPCHRLVGKDGSLTGYGGGLPTKRRLLELEGVDVTALRATRLAAAPRRRRGHADRD